MTKLDISSTAIEKGLDMVKGFVEKLAGSSIEEAGLIWADNVRLRRVRNQIKILEKAKKIAEKGNIDIKQINLKVLVPLLDYCSLEEEETLQDRWANLIANYADANTLYTSSIFPYILNQMNTDEVKEIERIYDKKGMKIIKIESQIISNNLVRLGLIEKEFLGAAHAVITFGIAPDPGYTITDLGKQFVECCKK